MQKQQISASAKRNINAWLKGSYDDDAKKQIKILMKTNPEELNDSFYQIMEFGTGGLRGVMGIGTNRMNKYTVGIATQGFINYLKKTAPKKQIKLVVAYDSRNNSKDFARISADVISANNCTAFLFNGIRPVPELSFAIRLLKADGGIMITASHNPKEYNGYKAYWSDGSQLVPPHDKTVINEVKKIKIIDEVNFNANPKKIKSIGAVVDEKYINQIKKLSLSPRAIAENKNLKIVYTPLHGTGVKLVPACLKKLGFVNIHTVKEQCVLNGDFPTVSHPNPEYPEAFSLAIKEAKKINADLILATDPDADRVGVATKNNKGDYVLLTGNQTASLLAYYILTRLNEIGKKSGKEYAIKTIVTTSMMEKIAAEKKFYCADVLPGFKWIGHLISQNEKNKKFIFGGEESYGYLVGDYARDKDGVSACCLIAEMTAWAKSQKMTLYDLLLQLYQKYGLYKQKLVNIYKEGQKGAEEINKIMEQFRKNPPKILNGSKVVIIKDYQKQIEIGRKKKKINLPKSNILQFFLADGSIITVRPSGTEPKIKFYIEVQGMMKEKNEFAKTDKILDKKISAICKDLKI